MEYTYKELKESSLLMQKPMPKFGVIMTVMTLIFVAGIILLAGFNNKTYVVKAGGQIVNEDKVYIMNSVSGNIKSINVTEGQTANKNDVLIEFDTLQIDVQIAQIQAAINYLDLKIENQNRLLDFMAEYTLEDIDVKDNPFDKNIQEEKQCYDDAEYFIKSVKNAITEDEIYNARVQLSSQPYQVISSYSYEKFNNEAKMQAYIDSLEDYKIKAETNGKVHFNTNLSSGMVLQAGTMIGSISGEDKELLYIDTIVDAANRSKLIVGSDVEIALSGIMQSEFGVLKGEVISIDNDSIQNDEGQVYYKLKIKPNSIVLSNKRNQEIELENGMVAECRIKYDETTWLNWALEQIGVKLR